jgi:hypothetical protein
MATSVTQSLFGLTPEAYQAQQAAEMDKQAMQFARMSPMESARYGLFQGINQLGSGIGQALGYQDPEMQRIKARQGLLGGIDMSDPAALRQAAKGVQGSDPAAAQELLRLAAARELEIAESGKVLAETQAKQAGLVNDQNAYAMRYQALKVRNPNMTDEVARAVAQDPVAFRETLKDPTAEFKTQDVDGRVKLYKVTPTGWELVQDLGASKPPASTNVVVGGSTVNLPDTTNATFQAADPEALKTYRTEARSASGQLGMIRQARDAVDSGAVTGTGIPGVVRSLNTVLAPLGINATTVANTRNLEQALNSIIAQGIKQYGANPSTVDLEFAKQASARLQDPKEAIKATLDYLEKRATALIDKQDAAEQWLAKNKNLAGFEKSWSTKENKILRGKLGKTSSGVQYEVIED